MNKSFFILLFILLIYSSCVIASESYSDIDSHWANCYISSLADDHIVNGYSDGTFRPNSNIKVSEFLKILLTQDGRSLVQSGDMFPDWYINTAIENGIINSNQFDNYSAYITRGEVVDIISNYVDVSNIKVSKANQPHFSDVSKERKEVIAKLAYLKIINGYKDNTFKENALVTRAESCKILFNIHLSRFKLLKDKVYKLTSQNTNMIDEKNISTYEGTRYLIQNNRIAFVPYKSQMSNTITANQEYVDDKTIIKLLKAVVDDYSYTALVYTQDKYILNKVSVIYSPRVEYINHGSCAFEISFFENGKLNVKEATGIDTFMEDASMQINFFKLFDKVSEYNSEDGISERYKIKLESAFEVIFGKSNASKVLNYLIQKKIQARNLEDNEFSPKIADSKTIGNYKFNVICNRGDILTIYAKKIK